jgi:hypothetical protein
MGSPIVGRSVGVPLPGLSADSSGSRRNRFGWNPTLHILLSCQRCRSIDRLASWRSIRHRSRPAPMQLRLSGVTVAGWALSPPSVAVRHQPRWRTDRLLNRAAVRTQGRHRGVAWIESRIGGLGLLRRLRVAPRPTLLTPDLRTGLRSDRGSLPRRRSRRELGSRRGGRVLRPLGSGHNRSRHDSGHPQYELRVSFIHGPSTSPARSVRKLHRTRNR